MIFALLGILIAAALFAYRTADEAEIVAIADEIDPPEAEPETPVPPIDDDAFIVMDLGERIEIDRRLADLEAHVAKLQDRVAEAEEDHAQATLTFGRRIYDLDIDTRVLGDDLAEAEPETPAGTDCDAWVPPDAAEIAEIKAKAYRMYVEDRFAKLEARVETLEAHSEADGGILQTIHERNDGIDDRLGALETRVDDHAQLATAHTQRIDAVTDRVEIMRLDAHARKVEWIRRAMFGREGF